MATINIPDPSDDALNGGCLDNKYVKKIVSKLNRTYRITIDPNATDVDIDDTDTDITITLPGIPNVQLCVGTPGNYVTQSCTLVGFIGGTEGEDE